MRERRGVSAVLPLFVQTRSALVLLYLTPSGRDVLADLKRIAEKAEAELLAALDASERSQLISLLQRVAASQGLVAGVHPNLDPRAADDHTAWEFGDPVGPTDYTLVERNTNAQGIGIPGGVGGVPEGYDGHVTFYVEVADVEAALAQAESLGGTRLMGPDQVPDGPVIAQFADPQGHVLGLVAAVP
jgi:predicted enzyme related to lactoylglutathione lyase